MCQESHQLLMYTTYLCYLCLKRHHREKRIFRLYACTHKHTHTHTNKHHSSLCSFSPDESTVCGVYIFPECLLTELTHLPTQLPIRDNKMTHWMPTTELKMASTILSHKRLFGYNTTGRIITVCLRIHLLGRASAALQLHQQRSILKIVEQRKQINDDVV